MAAERWAWLLPMTLSASVVLINVHSIRTIRSASRTLLPVGWCRPLAYSVIVAGLLRGTSAVCLSLFALVVSNPSPLELRVCRVLAFAQHWFTASTGCIMAVVLYLHVIDMPRSRDLSSQYRRFRLTAFVGAAGFYGFVTSFLPIVGWGSHVYQDKLYVCEIDNRSSIHYQLFLLSCGVLVPWIIGVLLYFTLLLKKHRNTNRIGPEIDARRTGSCGRQRLAIWTSGGSQILAEQEQVDPAGRRMIIIFVIFSLSWIHVVVLRCLCIYGLFDRKSENDIWPYVAMTTGGLVTSLVNPLALLGRRALTTKLWSAWTGTSEFRRYRLSYKNSTSGDVFDLETSRQCDGCYATAAAMCSVARQRPAETEVVRTPHNVVVRY